MGMEENCISFYVFLPKAERVHELNEEIGKLLAKVEQLGADGNVEESQKVMDEVEKARAKKREAEVKGESGCLLKSFSVGHWEGKLKR